MADYSIDIDIDAAPERIWEILVDVEQWSEWTASISSIERLDPGPLTVGSRVRISQPRLPVAIWTVTALTPGRSFTWATRGHGFGVLGIHAVEPRAGGARVTLSLIYSGMLGGLMARLTRAITTKYIAMEAAGLKRKSELEGRPRAD